MTKILSSKNQDILPPCGTSCYTLSIQHVRLHINGPGRKLALRFFSVFGRFKHAVRRGHWSLFCLGFFISFFMLPSLLYTLLLLLLLHRAWPLIFSQQLLSLFVCCRSFYILVQTYLARLHLSLHSSRLTE